MRLRRVLCATALFEGALFAPGGHEIHVAIDSGLPEGARLRWVGMVGATTVACDFEHDSFEEVPEGATPPLADPMVVRALPGMGQGGGVG